MSKPRLTVAVKRGLKWVEMTASYTLDSLEPGDLVKGQREEIERALGWLRSTIYAQQKKGDDDAR